MRWKKRLAGLAVMMLPWVAFLAISAMLKSSSLGLLIATLLISAWGLMLLISPDK